MEISSKVLSLPPHLSVAWSEVASLEVKQGTLIVHLKSGKLHEVPGLEQDTLKSVFEAHRESLEGGESSMEMSFGMPFKMPEEMEGFGMPLQHNSDQMDAPDIPAEILEKIVAVSRVVGVNQLLDNMAPAEPHCNCMYCQLARALHGEQMNEAEEEVVVSDEELTFREDWIVNPDEGNKQLYLVINPLNEKERYSVFLGNPIGCTCGQKNCDHIRAALNS